MLVPKMTILQNTKIIDYYYDKFKVLFIIVKSVWINVLYSTVMLIIIV